MTSSSCVLCATNIVKNCDKNLVVGRKNTVFNVREEILSLECEVVINTDYICRNCLAILKKRRALLTNLREVNKTIRKITSSKISSLPANITPVPYSGALLESDLQEQSSKRVALEDLRRSEPRDRDACTTSVERFPVISSTPRKEKGPVALPAVPVLPIVARSSTMNSKRERRCLVLFFGLPVFARANEKMHSGNHPCTCPPLFC